MSSPLIHAAHSPIAESPQDQLSEDEMTNYTQYGHNHLLQETTESLAGDLFFTILSPSSCTSHIGNESFIHNPEDGPYTPIFSSTPSYTGNTASDGYKTPSNQGSPHPTQSLPPVLTPKALRHHQVHPRTSSPTKMDPPTHATTAGNIESLPDATERTKMSYTMAAAARDAWANTAQNMELPFETREVAHNYYMQSEATVQRYSALLYQMEILKSMQQPFHQ